MLNPSPIQSVRNKPEFNSNIDMNIHEILDKKGKLLDIILHQVSPPVSVSKRNNCCYLQMLTTPDALWKIMKVDIQELQA